MKINKHAQSCIIMESRGSRIIVDPGIYLTEVEGLDISKLGSFDGILITHGHPDHMNPEVIESIIKDNEGIKIILNSDSADNLMGNSQVNHESLQIVNDNDWFKIGGFEITVKEFGHFAIPIEPPKLTGYLINNGSATVLVTGDCIDLDENVKAEIVSVPMSGPLGVDLDKAKESLLKVSAKVAIPVHNDSPSNGKKGIEKLFK